MIEGEVLTMRMNMERNPLRQVTLVARYQRILPASRFVLPIRAGFAQLCAALASLGESANKKNAKYDDYEGKQVIRNKP